MVACFTAVSAQTLTLSDDWLLQSSAHVKQGGAVLSTSRYSASDWFRISVPSTVMGALTPRSATPVSAADYQRIDSRQFDAGWWYRTTFSILPPNADEHVLLLFDGVSYRADVWLNGKLIAGREQLYGPFRQYVFDITPHVQKENVLAVEVFRAQPGEPNIGFVDWNPRPADESMGLFREVHVKKCRSVSVSHTAVRSKVNKTTLDEAWLTIDTELTNYADRPVRGTLCGRLEGRLFEVPVTLAAHEQRLVTLASDVLVQHPRLWWSHDLGTPELYDLHVEFREQQVSDCENVRFGVREVESYLTEEGHRGFKLNGRRLLIRGAGWTDDLYLRDTPATNHQQLEYVRHMNLNTIRLEGFWGNDQSLYDLCDQMGILLLAGWSCHWEWEDYLGAPCDERFGGITSPALIDLAARSLADQVMWLRRHPSVIGWMVGSDMRPAPELERRYRDFLAMADDRPYIISAGQCESELSGPSGMKMAGPYDYVSPAYWYHPQAPGGAVGFNTETGIGAQLPIRESLERMMGNQGLMPVDSRWDVLCTASKSAMNNLGRLSEAVNARFGVSPGSDRYLPCADLLNYESTRAMFEAFRVNEPRATGIVQWMLNAARPGVYWQLYDYYLQPNAAYYAVRRANAPLQLVYDYERRAVYAVNATRQPAIVRATMQLLVNGQPQCCDTLLTAQPGAAQLAFAVGERQNDALLLLRCYDVNGQELAANDYFLPAARDEYDWAKSNWYMTPITRYASYRMLNELPCPDVTLTARKLPSSEQRDTYAVTLSNSHHGAAFFLRLTARNRDGQLLCPAFWSDNYLSLAPGEVRTVTCDVPAGTDVSFYSNAFLQ